MRRRRHRHGQTPQIDIEFSKPSPAGMTVTKHATLTENESKFQRLMMMMRPKHLLVQQELLDIASTVQPHSR